MTFLDSTSLSFASKGKGHPCINTEGHHQQRLDGMNDKYEVQGLLVNHSIENQHGLYSEVPRTSSVGRWYNDRDAAHNEGYQGTGESQITGEVEAEEREVVMQEVAYPDT